MVVEPSDVHDGGVDVMVGTAGGVRAGALLNEALAADEHVPSFA